jgi:hypothetical protein
MYGQGDDWISCRPAGFMSKKFTSAQQHYAVHEMETLAILKALQKWKDKLIGKKVHIITDHKALEFFRTQSKLSSRQLKWTNYMSRFNFNIMYVKGEYNKVADSLSHYYESETTNKGHEFHEYVHVDRRLDPEGEDLPHTRIMEIKEWIVEIRALRTVKTKNNGRPVEAKEQQEIEANELRSHHQDQDINPEQDSRNNYIYWPTA